MALYGGNRRSHVIAVNRVVVCPVLANFRTLSAKGKDTLLRHTGVVQHAAHRQKPKQGSPKKGKGKCRQLISNCVRQTLKLVQSGRKVTRAYSSYSGCDWAAGTSGGTDESRSELWGTECRVVSVCGRSARSKPNGKDWIRQIRLDWKRVRMVSHTRKTESLLDRYAEVFEESLRTMNTFEASLSVCKIRPDLAVSFALKPAIE